VDVALTSAHPSWMDDCMELIRATGVALRREMLERGSTDKDIEASLRAGVLQRIRHGAYTSTEQWADATQVEKHRLRCVAVARVMPGQVALTHTSALVLQGINVWGADLETVHVTRLDGATGRACAGVRHHTGSFDEGALTLTDAGLTVTKPLRAVLEHASLSSVVSGLVPADHALHLGHFEAEQLMAHYGDLKQWPGMRHVQLVVRLADGRSESPGETRMRHLCWRCGLPAPELQYEVFDAHGRFVGRTDFAWPAYRLFGEFDGRGKYLRNLKPGQTVADAVLAEKQCEDRIRELTGGTFVRVTWPELDRYAETAERIRRQLLRVA
jgi:hypothetical protein